MTNRPRMRLTTLTVLGFAVAGFISCGDAEMPPNSAEKASGPPSTGTKETAEPVQPSEHAKPDESKEAVETPSQGAVTPDVAGIPAAEGEVTLKGRAMFKGVPPRTTGPKLNKMSGADPACAAMHPDGAYLEYIVVDPDGGLRDVFVYVKSGLKRNDWPVPNEQVLLDQRGCMYVPHVFGVMAGQEILIRNSDNTSHNIHALPKSNAEFNRGQPKQGMEMVETFKRAEMNVTIKCDVHPWMSAICHVMSHPFFATTAADGSFAIMGLAPGEYVIEARHDRLGTQSTTVIVSDGADEVDFTFERK